MNRCPFWCISYSIKRNVVRIFGILLIMFTAGTANASSGEHALELGLTPNHVFSIWTNINQALIVIYGITSDDPVQQHDIMKIKLQKFEQKIPADVLKEVHDFEHRIDKAWSDVQTIPAWVGVPKITPNDKTITENRQKITPSRVFLDSGHVLNDVISRIIQISDQDQLVSNFFIHHKFEGKTPSDVFGLVDLAHRRLTMILAQQTGSE